MRAVLYDRPGDPDVLFVGTTDDPEPGPEEVRVRASATALNRVDVLQRAGRYPVPPGASPILGLEVAGIVDRVGPDVDTPLVGDPVFALLSGGGYAERVVLPAAHCMPVPAKLGLTEAAAVPETFLTAYQALVWIAGLQAGASVLIHAGASGVGTSAIQLARSRGIVPYVTCSSGKRERCLELGAERAIDYRTERFAEVVTDATGGRGVDAVVDVIGAPYFDDNIASLAVDGTLVILATMGGSRVDGLDLRALFRRRLTVATTTLRTRSDAYKARLTTDFVRDVLPDLASGRVRPVIDSVLSWNDAADAHRRMEANQNVGKIVLEID